MVLTLHDRHAELVVIVHLVDEQRGVGAGRDDDGPTTKVFRRVDVALCARNPSELRNENRIGKSNLFLPSAHVSRRAAFDIDGTVSDEGDAVRRGYRSVFDREVGRAQFRLHGVDNSLAQFDGETDRLQGVAEVLQVQRAFAITDREGAGLLCLFQRAFQVLRPRWSGCADEQTGHCGERDCISHDTPPCYARASRSSFMVVAASTASPRRSTIVSICAASTMNGGAIRTWSPRAPSTVPPIG